MISSRYKEEVRLYATKLLPHRVELKAHLIRVDPRIGEMDESMVTVGYDVSEVIGHSVRKCPDRHRAETHLSISSTRPEPYAPEPLFPEIFLDLR